MRYSRKITLIFVVLMRMTFLNAQTTNVEKIEALNNASEAYEQHQKDENAFYQLFAEFSIFALTESMRNHQRRLESRKLKTYCLDGDCQNGKGRLGHQEIGLTWYYDGEFKGGVKEGKGTQYFIRRDSVILMDHGSFENDQFTYGIHNMYVQKTYGDRGFHHESIFYGRMEDGLRTGSGTLYHDYGMPSTLEDRARNMEFPSRVLLPNQFLWKTEGTWKKDTLVAGTISNHDYSKAERNSYGQLPPWPRTLPYKVSRKGTFYHSGATEYVYESFSYPNGKKWAETKHVIGASGSIQTITKIFYKNGTIWRIEEKSDALPFKRVTQQYDSLGELLFNAEFTQQWNPKKTSLNYLIEGEFKVPDGRWLSGVLRITKLIDSRTKEIKISPRKTQIQLDGVFINQENSKEQFRKKYKVSELADSYVDYLKLLTKIKYPKPF